MIIRVLIVVLSLFLATLSNAQSFIRDCSIDTVRDYSKTPFLLIKKDSQKNEYILLKSKKKLSKNISFIKGKDYLESYLRSSFQRDISDDCLSVNVPYVIIFSDKLKIKKIFLLYCPTFINAGTLNKFFKSNIKKTKGLWMANGEESEGYLYFGRLILI